MISVKNAWLHCPLLILGQALFVNVLVGIYPSVRSVHFQWIILDLSKSMNLNLGYFPDCIFGRELCDWNDFIFQSEPKAFMG